MALNFFFHNVLFLKIQNLSLYCFQTSEFSWPHPETLTLKKKSTELNVFLKIGDLGRGIVTQGRLHSEGCGVCLLTVKSK